MVSAKTVGKSRLHIKKMAIKILIQSKTKGGGESGVERGERGELGGNKKRNDRRSNISNTPL